MQILNIFYQEPDPDRWIKFDRYPRHIIRTMFRGPSKPGGQALVHINLLKGLDRIGVKYRNNNFKHVQRHKDELVCIVGKPQVLFDRKWQNPILFGASIFSHPLDCLELFKKYPVKKILVPGEWTKKMFEPYYGDNVISWPVGIDTDYWKATDQKEKTDFLIYYKIRWDNESIDNLTFTPIVKFLKKNKLSYQIIRYGSYTPNELKNGVNNAKSVIFLCEHETQGLAYQQVLSMGKPILAWDRGGYWQDPTYYPHKVKFNKGVSSVPYWDHRCGEKFSDFSDFKSKINNFILNINTFEPREYILDNLTLEICAQKYMEIVKSINY